MAIRNKMRVIVKFKFVKRYKSLPYHWQTASVKGIIFRRARISRISLINSRTVNSLSITMIVIK